MSKIEAIVVADSTNPQNDRLTSVLVTMPRIILSEMNTHRMLSKNTSSSRAIPFNKMVESVQNDPFIPIAWQKHHSGMQGNEYITDSTIVEECISSWLAGRDDMIEIAANMNCNQEVTKQICNRLLEPFMWTTMLITGSKEGWENFFSLRCPQYSFGSNTTTPKIWKSRKDAVKDFPDWISRNDFYWNTINKGQAEIHIMALAECIWDAVNESTPKQLKAGEWHIPFENKIDLRELANIIPHYQNNNGDIINNKKLTEAKVQISTAMAAHTSYTTVGNEPVKTYEDWIKLHNKLVAYDPPHSSPMEHCARVMSNEEYFLFNKGKGESIHNLGISYSNPVVNFHKKDKGWCGPYKGFISYRHFIDNNLET